MNLLSEVAAAASLPTPAIARALRVRAGISQARIARELGVSRMTVSRWESGAHRPRGVHLVAYGALLRDLHRIAEAKP